MSELHINDIFFSIQGEGAYTGVRSLVVRMPYCNLTCPYCDTQFNSHKKYTEDELCAYFVREPTTRHCVLTGGEPMMHKHTPAVVELLKRAGFTVACETNGHFPIVDGIDFVTCSPKRFAKEPYYVHPDVWPRVNEFKYVVDENFDFDLLQRHDTKDGRIYSLSPEFGDMRKQVSRIIHFLANHTGWKLNLQTHKWIGVA